MPSDRKHADRLARSGQRLVNFYIEDELLDQLDAKLEGSKFKTRSEFLRAKIVQYVGRK